ncbi:hypothetical protein GQ600_3767 [Phytophthora cactorum]|nr:hypothetical protein GQ600_3767 [Phytophthora cactorum]
MTPRYAWKTVCSDMAREDSQLLMEDMKVFIIVKSQLVPCSVCALTRPHKMRYQLLRCSPTPARQQAPYDACQWLGKKYRKRKRLKVERAYIEAEAEED